MKPKSAQGVRGCLLYNGYNNYFLRVYDANHNYKDYDILHCDLEVEIVDSDAYFYETTDGGVLDHSPLTLGHYNE